MAERESSRYWDLDECRWQPSPAAAAPAAAALDPRADQPAGEAEAVVLPASPS